MTTTETKTLLFKAFVPYWDINELVYGNDFAPKNAVFSTREDAEEYLFSKKISDLMLKASWFAYKKTEYKSYDMKWEKELDKEGNMTITGYVLPGNAYDGFSGLNHVSH